MSGHAKCSSGTERQRPSRPGAAGRGRSPRQGRDHTAASRPARRNGSVADRRLRSASMSMGQPASHIRERARQHHPEALAAERRRQRAPWSSGGGRVSASCARNPSDRRSRRREAPSRVSRSRTASGSAPDHDAAAHRCADGSPATLGAGHGSPLRGSWRPDEDDGVLPARRLGLLGDEDAVRDDLALDRRATCPPSRARAPRRRCAGRPGPSGNPTPGMPSRIQPRSPDAWWVATTGALREGERGDADRRRHRLVEVEHVEPLPLEHAPDRGRTTAG